MMRYEEFGSLKFKSFFPETPDFDIEDDGLIDYGTGYSGKSGYNSTLFAHRRKDRETTAIILEFSDDCPEDEGHRLLAFLDLPFRNGMRRDEILNLMEFPEVDEPLFLRFIIGMVDRYYVTCSINEKHGLFRVWIARKDLADLSQSD